MNRFIFPLFAVMMMLSSCSKDVPVAPAEVELSVKGMTCESCVNSITTAVNKLPGVSSCEVSLEQESAVVSYNANALNEEQIRKRISQLGFETGLQTPEINQP